MGRHRTRSSGQGGPGRARRSGTTGGDGEGLGAWEMADEEMADTVEIHIHERCSLGEMPDACWLVKCVQSAGKPGKGQMKPPVVANWIFTRD